MDDREELITSTAEFWQSRSPRRFSREDARQAIENVTGFFQVLAKWSATRGEPQAAKDSNEEETEDREQ